MGVKMLLTFLKSKLHMASVTGAELMYDAIDYLWGSFFFDGCCTGCFKVVLRGGG